MEKILVVVAIVSLLLIGSAQAVAPNMTVHSPVDGKVYNTQSMLLNVSTDVVSNVSYSFIGGAWIYLYQNGLSGTSSITALEGQNNITFSAVNGSNSINRTVYFSVDVQPPVVTLRLPEQSAAITDPKATFEFLVTDNMDNSLNCSLFVDNSQINSTNVANNTRGYITHKLGAGSHNWKASCTDDAGNTGEGQYRTLTVSSSCDVIASEIFVEPNDNITFYLENAGTNLQTVDYKIFVNLEERAAGYTTLNPGEKKKMSHHYSFTNSGDFNIKVEAVAECGSSVKVNDVVEAGYHRLPPSSPGSPGIPPGTDGPGQASCIVPGGSNSEIRCDTVGKKLFQCQNGQWRTYSTEPFVYCNSCSHCGDGVANCGETKETCSRDFSGVTTICDCTGKRVFIDGIKIEGRSFYDSCKSQCGLGCYTDSECLTGFTCKDFVCKPAPGSCGVDIKYMDLVDQLAVGEEAFITPTIRNTGAVLENITLRLYIDNVGRGQYEFSLSPGSESLRTFFYNTTLGQHLLKVEAIASCSASDIETASIEVFNISTSTATRNLVTSADLEPGKLNTTIGSQKKLTILLATSEPQVFKIQVTGVDENWLDYPKIVGVTQDRSIDIYVKPDKIGDFNLTVSVEGGSLNFTNTSLLMVFPDKPVKELGKDNSTIIIVALIIIFALVVFLGARYLEW